jgi:aldose 1-epimerase
MHRRLFWVVEESKKSPSWGEIAVSNNGREYSPSDVAPGEHPDKHKKKRKKKERIVKETKPKHKHKHKQYSSGIFQTFVNCESAGNEALFIMVKLLTIFASLTATIKSFMAGGSPFAGFTALWPTNEDGKYIIQAEGIRMAFTNRNGGAPTNVWINDTNGYEVDIILGLDQVEDYDNYIGYLGGTIGKALLPFSSFQNGNAANRVHHAGRVAGHISGANFEVDGQRFYTSPNGNNGTTTYNGGEKGWERINLDVGSVTPNSITFVVFDRAGKNGFPGNSGSSLTHSLYPYEWRISYGVTPTRTSKPVPINLSHKTYWNLDGFCPGSETIEEHRLHLPFSGLRLEEDEHQVPTGDIKGNKKHSPYDFWSAPRLLAAGLAHKDTYNDLFLVNRPQPWEKDSNPVAVLSSARSGITVEMYTDQEAVRLVTWDGDPNCKFCSFIGGFGKKSITVASQFYSKSHPQKWSRRTTGSEECRHFDADDGLGRCPESSGVATW